MYKKYLIKDMRQSYIYDEIKNRVIEKVKGQNRELEEA